MRNEITQFLDNVGDEHRGGFLDVIAAGMEEGIEGELGTTLKVVTFGATGDSLSRNEE